MPLGSGDDIAFQLIARGHAAIQEVLLRAAEEIKAETIRNIPVGDPDLDPNPDYALRDHVVIRLYGDFASISVEGSYALKQHENQSFQHPRGGQAKYLERAVATVIPTLGPRFAATLQREFRDVRGGRSRERLVETLIRPKP